MYNFFTQIMSGDISGVADTLESVTETIGDTVSGAVSEIAASGAEAVANTSGVVSAAGAGNPGGLGAMWGQFGLIGLMIVAFYFILIRPQRKKEKETAKMRDKLEVGDIVTTTGGIIGIVVSIKDDSIVIETGNDRSKIRIKKWAIQSNETIHESE